MTSKAGAKTMAVAIMLTLSMPITTPASADPAIYEVVSEAIPAADITYFDGTQYQRAEQVSLPWTTEVHLGDLTGNGHTSSRAEPTARDLGEEDRKQAVACGVCEPDYALEALTRLLAFVPNSRCTAPRRKHQ
ncbi:hypothetical protein DE4585_02640 [Mycobacteroides salmoniphilum]|uniref:Uncharacterized protein n=1 Tax=Mycobacteroides salmoniphilum TaxID=404941 RepID=A0A4R8S0D4_9MYCO|nr:hypothetical protein [Mycobacteroides salmoniphilum]TDZ82111.1 hypothetical protein DE4585_02640 [Mycobacteroides salmoniphilum]